MDHVAKKEALISLVQGISESAAVESAFEFSSSPFLLLCLPSWENFNIKKKRFSNLYIFFFFFHIFSFKT